VQHRRFREIPPFLATHPEKFLGLCPFPVGGIILSKLQTVREILTTGRHCNNPKAKRQSSGDH
jgi:hypothetical protein